MLFSVPTANGMMKWQEVNFKILPRELVSQDTIDACSTAKHGLRVTFSPDMSIQEKAQQKPPSHTKLKEIEDFCSVLCEMKTPGFGLGFYLDSEGKLRGPYPAESSDDSASTDQSITLAELLGKKVQWKGKVCTLTRKERYKLAVTLASSLYQLESTPWMTTALAKQDIVFSQAQAAALRPVNIEYPYVSKSFPDQIPHVDCAESPVSISSGSSSLLALGILLLELYTGRPFEESQIDSKLNDLSRLMIWSTAAKDWLVDEDGDLAAGWTSAVSYCIDGFKQGPVLSEEDATQFRQGLLEQVVLPLHEETERFLVKYVMGIRMDVALSAWVCVFVLCSGFVWFWRLATNWRLIYENSLAVRRVQRSSPATNEFLFMPPPWPSRLFPNKIVLSGTFFWHSRGYSYSESAIIKVFSISTL